MKLRLPNIPKSEDIEAAITERRCEIAELKELLRLAQLRELGKSLVSQHPRKRQSQGGTA